MTTYNTIDVDAGGTFTDGFFQYDGITKTVKVPTTKHDLTICFVNCIERGAEQFDISVQELLSDTDAVRFSTTLGTNTIIEKTGPKIGVLVTEGHGESLYAAGENKAIADGFVEPEMVSAIGEEVDETGTVQKMPDPDSVIKSVKSLQERGARIIVVTLANAQANTQNEQAVKHMIESEYPRHYIGSIPTLASHEVTSRPGDYERLNTTVLNAYLHRPMKSGLYKAEDKIRNRGYSNPLFVGHSSGGVTRVAKTVALNTHNSGPAAGVHGVEKLSELYGQSILAADMGGTSIDLSFVRKGNKTISLNPEIGTLPTHIPAVKVANYGIGGGSIVTVEDGKLSVGPESAGANPGPACFDQGGTDPTVTDADVVLGYVNPDYFLGGRRQLSRDKAYTAIEENIAGPLDLSVEEAALRVAAETERSIGSFIDDISDEPATVAAYGGAGPVHAAGFVSESTAEEVLLTPFSSVFSAFGESAMDVQHTYAESLQSIGDTSIQATIEEMQNEAEKDMRAEGFAADKIHFEIDVLEDATDVLVHPLGTSISGDQVKHVLEEVDKRRSTLRLHATGNLPSPTFEKRAIQGESPAAARKEDRELYWEGGFEQTPIYSFESLEPGNTLTGPAVIEATDTTVTVPKTSTLRVNEYGHIIID